MSHLFGFKLPRRWKLHRRSHSRTTAHDTPRGDTTKSDTSAKIDNATPKSDPPPTDTKSEISYLSDSKIDYFGLPFLDISGEKMKPKAKPATKDLTMPLEELRSLESHLFRAQLNQTTIKLLEAEVRKTKCTVAIREQTIRLYRQELEEAREMLYELRSNTGNNLTTKNVCHERLINNPVSKCQPPPTPPTMTDREGSDLFSSDSAPTSSCSSSWACPYM